MFWAVLTIEQKIFHLFGRALKIVFGPVWKIHFLEKFGIILVIE